MMAGAMAGSGSRLPTPPRSNAAFGIPYTTQVVSSSASVVPPRSEISFKARAPSLAHPGQQHGEQARAVDALEKQDVTSTAGRTPWIGGSSVSRAIPPGSNCK